MRRREFLLGAAAATLARPALAQGERAQVLRFVPYTDLSVFDPIWTTADIVRDHGYLVYDTLYGLDGTFQPSPQLAEGHVFDEEERVCTIRLREGPTFHDGAPVRAQDCVASLRRWMAVAPMGQTLQAHLDELAAIDDRRLRFRLKRAFPPLLHVLAQSVAPVPFIMPERVALTDPAKQLTDTTGSGPFRFKRDEYQSGNLAAYERFAAYRPTPATAKGLTAGPKIAHFERIEWRRIPDPSTAASALRTGEVDWFADPLPELVDLFKTVPGIEVSRMDLLPTVCVMRFNCLNPIFNDKRMRQALLPAIDQAEFVMGAAGTDPERFRVGTGFFPPGSAMASDVGLEPLLGPRDLGKAKRLLKEAGYDGQLVRLLGAVDTGATAVLAEVAADLFRRLGLNLDATLLESGAVTQRRRSQEPVERGGWSVSCWAFPGLWFENPSTNIMLRGNGRDAWYGWPTIPKLEELRDAWMAATDLGAQRAIAREMQRIGMDELPAIPLGSIFRFTALRRELTHRVAGFPIFWNLRRA